MGIPFPITIFFYQDHIIIFNHGKYVIAHELKDQHKWPCLTVDSYTVNTKFWYWNIFYWIENCWPTKSCSEFNRVVEPDRLQSGSGWSILATSGPHKIIEFRSNADFESGSTHKSLYPYPIGAPTGPPTLVYDNGHYRYISGHYIKACSCQRMLISTHD
jgi:hypothetical protein